MLLQKSQSTPRRLKSVFKNPISLSAYFPAGTQFYYGYPAGKDSGFLNKVTPENEELVAARALSCAGPSVEIVCFSATSSRSIDPQLLKDLSVPQLRPEQTVIFPDKIDIRQTGKKRNKLIKKALKSLLRPHAFVMAQPYLDEQLDEFYQIPARLTSWLNDKHHMGDFIDTKWLPKRLGAFESGAAFAKGAAAVSLPAVIKASSSSSGDGVCICTDSVDLKRAAKKFRSIQGTVIAEENINTVKNYGVHFGIPYDKERPIDLIGINEQLTTDEGEFVGGIIDTTQIPEPLHGAVEHLRDEVLLKIRAMGWYGIGGFDILLDEKNRAYFIDCNFRMTGMSAYHLLVANGELDMPVLSLTGEFKGSQADFMRGIYPFAAGQNKSLHIISLSRNKDIWRFNAALTYKTESERRMRAQQLRAAGVASVALEMAS